MEKIETERIPFFRSLRGKYAVTYLIVIAAVLILMNTYPVWATQNMVMQQSKKTALQSQTAAMASALTELETLSSERVSRVMEVLGETELDRILVTDPSGLVLYDSAQTDQEDQEELPRQYALFREVTTALSGMDVFQSEYQNGVIISSAAEPLMYRNVVIGSLYVYEADAAQGSLLLGLQTNLRNISIVIVLLVIALSLVFSRALTSRVNVLLKAIRVVREGEYGHRVTLKGRDEITLLADEFSQLTDRLQTTEEVRRRFVSDASHELKTPLASIRLLTDSILQSENMDAETLHDFVSDIGSEAERLTHITEDLLTLTRLDGAVPGEHCLPVSVETVTARVVKMLLPLAGAVQVELTWSCQPGCVIEATEDGLYKIIYNLVENAIKYNLPGGSVNLSAELTDQAGNAAETLEADHVTLRVLDTGVGIPEEDQSKIFGRFYRVDKARSREAGGTGLGLAIVRDAVLQYHGQIAVRSRTDCRGTEFTAIFPRYQEGETPL